MVALLPGHLGQALDGLVELLEIASVDLEQPLEAGDEVVVSGHGVELCIVDLA